MRDLNRTTLCVVQNGNGGNEFIATDVGDASARASTLNNLRCSR